LPVGVAGGQLRAKFLLPGASQVHNPVGKGVEALPDQSSLQAVPAQIGAHAQRALAPRGVVGHEILQVAPIIEQFLGTQRFEQRRNDHCIVPLIEELTAQILGRVVAAGERIERRRAGRTRIERFGLRATQAATPL
jgi:hypothetical protein